MTTIVANGTTLTVTVASGETITSDSTIDTTGLLDGSGNVMGAFDLVNLGTISADVSAAVLSINTGTLNNEGTVFANQGSLTIQSGVAVTNLSGGTLTGGVWEASGTGTLALLSGPITTDNATITLNGVSSAFESGGGTPQPIENTLTTVATSGVLNLLGGRDFVTAASLAVNGTVDLGGGTITAGGLGMSIGSGGRVVGFGTLTPGSPVANAGMIEANGGTLAVPQSGVLSGAGTLQTDALSSLVLTANSNPYSERIINNGTIDAAFEGISAKLEMSGSYSGSGGFLIQGAASGGTTILELPVNLSANVAFDTNVGELLLDFASSFNGTVSGFGDHSTLVMDDIGEAVSATLSGNVLSMNGAGVSQKITLNVASMNYRNAVWTVTDNINGTAATLTVAGVTTACFAKGTQIATETGEVAVEHLAVGDNVHAHFANSRRSSGSVTVMSTAVAIHSPPKSGRSGFSPMRSAQGCRIAMCCCLPITRSSSRTC